MLTNLLRSSDTSGDGAVSAVHDSGSRSGSDEDAEASAEADGVSGARLARDTSRLETVPELDEQTPLLSTSTSKQSAERDRRGSRGGDLEAQGAWQPSTLRWLRRRAGSRTAECATVLANPRKWDGRAVWRSAVVTPASYLPAVLVGLLLNILDALSYGLFC